MNMTLRACLKNVRQTSCLPVLVDILPPNCGAGCPDTGRLEACPTIFKHPLRAFGWVLWLACCLASRAEAASTSVPALELDPPTLFRSDFLDNTNGMYGWAFQVLEPISVTGLAWYDEGQNGLVQGHEVGLWWTSTSWLTNYLVSSVSIPPGTQAELDGIYRKVDLPSSITLDPGWHVIGGTYSFDSGEQVANGVAHSSSEWVQDPRISLLFPAWAVGGGFHIPDEGFLGYGVNVGPMFYIEPIPEPPPVALLLIGFLFFTARRAHRIRRSTVAQMPLS